MKQAAIQFPENNRAGETASKILNIAIGMVLVALVATGGVLAYMHFRPAVKAPNSLEATLEKWQTAVDNDPGNSLLRANLGATYQDLGKPEEAIRELRIALDQDPENYAFMFRLGFSYRSAGDYDAAIGMFLDSSDRNPKSEKYSSLYEAAETCMLKGDVPAAKDYVQQSIADNDMIWNTHFLLGRIIEQEGDTAGAKAQYETASKYNPNDQALREALARVSG